MGMSINKGYAGYRDWKLQRLSAIVMIAYVCFLFAFFVGHAHLTYDRWAALFSSVWMQVSTMVVILLLLIHTWIGLWTIGTDYIKNLFLHTVYNACVFIALLGFFFWAAHILWSF